MLPSDYQVSVDNLKNITKAKANHFRLGVIQCLRRQEKVGRWSKKCSFLSTFRVKVVYVEVGRWSKKDQILST